jgi:tetratricopeptide (TPR) repeat protein
MIAAMRIGSHEIVSTLGQGGMGVVYAARSPEGRDVAVKVLRKNDGEALARFERERRLLASFGEAKGFVPLLDAGVTPAGPYLVMPLVPGGTLRRRLEAGPLGIEETVTLGLRLAFALGEAHARGIVHRDMKPENVLFTAAGHPLIADLGLAKHFDPGAPGASQSVSLSMHGALQGTAGYMAPEQMADARSAGPAADVFAMGAIMYECAAGGPAFLGANVLDLLVKVEEGKFESLRDRRPDVPVWLAAIVERALAPAALDRFPDGLALGRALAARGEEASRGSRRLVTAFRACAGLVALAGALGAFFAFRPLPSGARSIDAPSPPVPAPADGSRTRAGGLIDAKKRVDEALASGAERYAAGDYDGAIRDYARAIQLDPLNALGWAGRGDAKEGKGDWGDAITDFTRAVELDPKYAAAWHDQAVARGKVGDYVGAIGDFTRAIELAPKVAKGWGGRGDARKANGNWDGAIADYARAVELDPRFAAAWYNLAAAMAKKGDYDGAIADYGHFLELKPNGPQAPAVRREIARLEGLRDKR